MSRLLICASGPTLSERNHKRGELFEKLVANLLDRLGYEIADLRTNYAGMEIDVEGCRKLTRRPFTGECKAHDRDVDAPRLQKFFGKYMSMWLANKSHEGVFVALPGLNGAAKGFYNTYIAEQSQVSVALLEEAAVIRHLAETGLVATANDVRTTVARLDLGAVGDTELLYTEREFIWVQRIVPSGDTLPRFAYCLSSYGELITDSESLDFVSRVHPPSEAYGLTAPAPRVGLRAPIVEENTLEDVVEIQGSTSCFEYQLPASPEYFFGRAEFVNECRSVIDAARSQRKGPRGFLVLANSGWGKSSLMLKVRAHVPLQDGIVVAIDSRSATTQNFPLKAFSYAITEAQDRGVISKEPCPIGGISTLLATLTKIDSELKAKGKVIVVIFDQFENLFFNRTTLAAIRTLFARISEQSLNIVLGFCWKIDLLSTTEDFPYELRDEIRDRCHVVRLGPFGEHETTEVLDALAFELRTKLRRDVAFQLREYSQGYPWLLKKLCAHVIRQRRRGIKQVDMASSMLNVRQLFDDDLGDLTPEQDATLRAIARVAPVLAHEISDDEPATIIQSLINRRLVVRIGSKYDIYWDIFRDYLNTGALPVEEAYILRVPLGMALRVLKSIRDEGQLSSSDFSKLGYTEKTFFNVLRDIRLLGLVEFKNGLVEWVGEPPSDDEFSAHTKKHVRERLRRHKTVAELLRQVNELGAMGVAEIVSVVRRSFPYISADGDTFVTYAKTFCSWIDYAELAAWDAQANLLVKFDPTAAVRSRQHSYRRRESGVYIPEVQASPIHMAMMRIQAALNRSRPLTSKDMRPSTWRKAIRAAEALGFLTIDASVVRVSPQGIIYMNSSPEAQREVFRQSAEQLACVQIFVRLLESPSGPSLSVSQLGMSLRDALGKDWRAETAAVVAKVLLNWCKFAGLTSTSRRPPRRRSLSGDLF